MNVREQALAAHAEAIHSERAAVAEHTRQDRIKRAEQEQHLLALVRESALAEWFPTAKWEVYAVPADEAFNGMRGFRTRGGFKVTQLEGIVCTDRPGGTDPEWAGVPCFGIGPLEPNLDAVGDDGAPDRARVFYCHTRYDEGYTSWEGGEVRSLEELGERIAQWEKTDKGRAASLRAAAAKLVPDLGDGGECARQELMQGYSEVRGWEDHARRAGEPEGRTTGLHRDSMG